MGIVFRPMPSIRLGGARNGSPPSGAGVLIRDESSKQRQAGQGKANNKVSNAGAGRVRGIGYLLLDMGSESAMSQGIVIL